MKRILCLTITLMMIFSVCFSCFLTYAHAEEVTSGNTYWVSPSGAAAWENAKSSTPLEGTACTSLAKANEKVKAGDTVYLREGTYNGFIFPGKGNGVPDTDMDHRIVYSSYDGDDEDAVIYNQTTHGTYYYGILLSNVNYVKINGIKFRRDPSIARGKSRFFNILAGSSYTEISNCDFNGQGDGEFSIWDGKSSDGNDTDPACLHTWIHHCTFRDTANIYVSGGKTNDAVTGLQLGTVDWDGHSDHTTIEDCTFSHMGHHCIETFTKYNVIRNNYFRNEGWMDNNTGVLTYSAPDTNGKWGNRNIVIGDGYNQDGKWNLVEGNKLGTTGPPPDDDGGNGLDIVSPRNIVRYNDIFNSQNSGILMKSMTNSSGVDYYRADHNRIYNNTVYNSGRYNNARIDPYPGTTWQGNSVQWYREDVYNNRVGNVFKNNIFYKYGGDYDILLKPGNTVENNWYTANGGNPEFVNPDVDPMSEALPDLNLKSNSAAIDDGAPLTKATNSAAVSSPSNILKVGDAQYFQDGTWGSDLARGVTFFPDEIAIGSPDNVVKISSIDYATNTITLAESRAWNTNDLIWLYKDSAGKVVLEGLKSDLGAHEFSGTKVNSAPTIMIISPEKPTVPSLHLPHLMGTDFNVSAVVKDDVAPVKVEYFLDGVKVGETTTAPFNFSIPGIQKGLHKVHGVAYDAEGLSTKSAEVLVAVGDIQKPVILTEAIFNNILFSTLTGNVSATFDVVPLGDHVTGAIGLTRGVSSKFDQTAAFIRFKDTGIIDAITQNDNGGSAYAAVNVIPYSAMKTYRVKMNVDLTNHVYSATVTDEEGNTQVVADNYKFRHTMKDTSELDHIVGYSGVSTMVVTKYSVGVEATEVSIDENATVEVGGTKTLTATVLPENATIKQLEWTSSDTAVATVSDNGTVTGVAVGTATITVKVAGTALQDTCTVTVSAQKPGIKVTGPDFVVKGETFKADVLINPALQSILDADIIINYNPDLFELVESKPVDDGFSLAGRKTIEPGKERFLLAGAGLDKAITVEKKVLELTFKAKETKGSGETAIAEAGLVNISGVLVSPTLSGKTTKVISALGDFNDDDIVNVLDLYFVSVNYYKNSTSQDWNAVKIADTNNDGKIDISDLAFVAMKILE